MTTGEEGLKIKYNVFKADTGEQIFNCFVLRPDKDPAAVEAIRTYAAATGNANLASDLLRWVGSEPPLTLDELRKMHGEPVWVDDLVIPNCGCYHFVKNNGAHTFLFEATANDDSYYDADNKYGKTWLAYRHKPMEGTT